MKRFFLLCIGNELLNGKISDRNGQFLAKELTSYSHQLIGQLFLPDSWLEFQQGMDLALHSSDIILLSGGLGPTKDDQTKSFLARYFGLSLEKNEQAFQLAKLQYQKIGKDFESSMSQYEKIPLGFSPLENKQGLAPGLKYEWNKKTIVALPGVPREFYSMALDLIQSLAPAECFTKLMTAKTLGLPEEVIFNQKSKELWTQLEKYGEVSSLPHSLGVDIGVVLKENDLSKIEDKEKAVMDVIQKSEISSYIIAWGNQPLQEHLFKILQERNLTLSTAESCTGGLIASMITDIPGSSQCFQGSIVSYSNQSKIDLLAVHKDTINQFGAVSIQVVEQMLKGAQQKFNTDITLATSGIAGPGGGSSEKPVGTLVYGIRIKDQSFVEKIHFKGNRKLLKERFALQVISSALKKLKDLSLCDDPLLSYKKDHE